MDEIYRLIGKAIEQFQMLEQYFYLLLFVETIGIDAKDINSIPHKDIEEFNKLEKMTLGAKLNKIKQLIHEIKDDNPNKDRIISDLELKLKIAEELYMNFNFDSIKKMTITNAHGDYSIQQLIYNDKLGTTVIDFETAKSLPIVWEIIRSYSYIDKEAKDGCFNVKTLVEYFKEFSKYVKLNEYDLKYAPYLYLLQLIGSVFGYKEYNNDFEQVGLLEFAFFRTKLSHIS